MVREKVICKLNLKLLSILLLFLFLPSLLVSQSVTITLEELETWMVEVATLKYSLQTKQEQLSEWQSKSLISAQQAETLQTKLEQFQIEIERLEQESAILNQDSQKTLNELQKFMTQWKLLEDELQRKIKNRNIIIGVSVGVIIIEAITIGIMANMIYN